MQRRRLCATAAARARAGEREERNRAAAAALLWGRRTILEEGARQRARGRHGSDAEAAVKSCGRRKGNGASWACGMAKLGRPRFGEGYFF